MENNRRAKQTEQQKIRDRKTARLRRARFRERKKATQGESTPGCSKEKNVTAKQKGRPRRAEKTLEAQKAQQRAIMSSQKKRRILERQRAKYRAEKQKNDNGCSSSPSNSFIWPSTPISSPPSHQAESKSRYKTKAGQRKASRKVENVMPASPGKYAAVIEQLVKRATPKKQKHLRHQGLQTRQHRRRSCSFTVVP